MKKFLNIVCVLLFTVALSHVSFSQEDQPQGHDPTVMVIENQTESNSIFAIRTQAVTATTFNQVDICYSQEYANQLVTPLTLKSDLPKVVPLCVYSFISTADTKNKNYMGQDIFQRKYWKVISSKIC